MTANPHPMPREMLDEHETAELLALSVRTLQSWRLRGGGPIFHRLGRAVRYRRQDLEAWLATNAMRNTSELPR